LEGKGRGPKINAGRKGRGSRGKGHPGKKRWFAPHHGYGEEGLRRKSSLNEKKDNSASAEQWRELWSSADMGKRGVRTSGEQPASKMGNFLFQWGEGDKDTPDPAAF